jgi:hypothetical protein
MYSFTNSRDLSNRWLRDLQRDLLQGKSNGMTAASAACAFPAPHVRRR